MAEKFPLFEYVGELPKSDFPWVISLYGETVALLNREHPPMVVIDGKLELMRFEGSND